MNKTVIVWRTYKAMEGWTILSYRIRMSRKRALRLGLIQENSMLMTVRIVQTNQPSRLIYHIACCINFAHTPEEILKIVAESPYRYIRICTT